MAPRDKPEGDGVYKGADQPRRERGVSASILDRNNVVLAARDRVRTHVVGKYVHYGPNHVRTVPEGVLGTIYLFTDDLDVRVQIEIDENIVLADYRPHQLSKF